MTTANTTTQAARCSAKPSLNPVGLLRDERGIYGLGLTDEYLEADLPKELLNYEGTPPRDNKLILRPDRINEACGYRHPPILQMLPRGFRETQECDLRDEMVKVMHYCAGGPAGQNWIYQSGPPAQIPRPSDQGDAHHQFDDPPSDCSR